MSKVHNINGTFQTSCKCGTWLDHWKNFSDNDIIQCAEVSCKNTDIFGAHVQILDSNDDFWFIVPLCKMHNQSTGVLDVGTTKLVDANKESTCEIVHKKKLLFT